MVIVPFLLGSLLQDVPYASKPKLTQSANMIPNVFVKLDSNGYVLVTWFVAKQAGPIQLERLPSNSSSRITLNG